MARTKTATKKTTKARRTPGALPRAVARLALDRATRTLRTLCRAHAANVWKIGRELAEVGRLELHRARGFPRIEDYAAAALGLSRDTTFQYMRVAEAFSEAVVEAFGPERLDRGLRYLAATPEDDRPAELPASKVRVRDGDGAVREKDFAETTLAELRAATAAEKRAAAPRSKRQDPAREAAVLEAANAALDAAVGRAAARDAELRLRRTAAGREVLDLRGVPLAKAPAALRAVAKALAPL
ncbi:MAG: hypothetical protein HY909_16535 [Deltaproteobacteria bacterium]|nr:hypothetical protein [Deltaproteobacteria bacterium]